MFFSNEKSQAILSSSLQELLKLDLNFEERNILEFEKKSLDNGSYLQQVVFNLKNKLSPLAINNLLSVEVLKFYTELSRQYPTNGASSLFNVFISKIK